MNRTVFWDVLLLLALSVLPANAIPLTDNANKHNLSSTATHGGPQANLPENGGTTEICVFCHTPHGASSQSTLWNRPDPASMGSFPLYGGGQLVIKGDYPGSPAGAADRSQYKDDGSVEYPNGASKMCLSCHDGVTAMGQLLTGGTIAMVNESLFSQIVDLAASHPVSFVYDEAVWGDIQSVKPGAYNAPPLAVGYVPLDAQSRMQCTTCHDPHTDTRGRPHALPFWRHDIDDVTAAYDDVCNACHAAPTTAPGHGL